MSLRATIFSRCTTGGHAGLSALIGTKCFPDVAPREEYAGTGKFLVYRLISAPQYARDRTQTGRVKARVQFDCYDATGDGADALGAQVIAAWDNYSDPCDIGYAKTLTRSQTWEEGLNRWRQIVEVEIEHSTSI